ncbi:hypothetical protein HPB52_021791 [Rhipicephalus sanguineus]|uniref:Uncharacterized protein n=1 Tax=Rhipicephalus sanguineus TaxID=34632 RepID=A0A9D4QB18_RHISA|nr:hypothetical protein HPB52_021791 [Rhipicephalus sanguineus]
MTHREAARPLAPADAQDEVRGLHHHASHDGGRTRPAASPFIFGTACGAPVTASSAVREIASVLTPMLESPDVETEWYGSPTGWTHKQSSEEDAVVEISKLGPSARRLTSAPGGCRHRRCCLPPENHNHAKPGPQQRPRR